MYKVAIKLKYSIKVQVPGQVVSQTALCQTHVGPK